MQSMRRPDGMVSIIAVARSVGRSVDAVIGRLTARHGADAKILGRLHVDVEEIAAAPKAEPVREVEPKVAVASATAQGKQRTCLRCRRLFWSANVGNRICGPCARANEQAMFW